MRRARIKALAAVPMRKRPIQDASIPTEANSESDKDLDTPDTVKQEASENAAEVELENKDSFTTDTLEQEAKQFTNVPEEIVVTQRTTEQTELTNLKVEKSASPEKSGRDCQEARAKPEFQEPRIDAKSDSTESCVQLQKSSRDSSPQKKTCQSSSSCIKARPGTCVRTQSDSQKLFDQAKRDSQESSRSSMPRDQIDNNAEKHISHATLAKVPPLDLPTGTDIVSPIKMTQNRPCFMRPIPRLDSSGRIRKNSIQGSGASASESEDEHGKRTVALAPSRIRNDSVCSVQSNRESIVNDGQSNSARMKNTQKRRMLISESARKLAEARREFLLKHENKTPDRSQLKMYDLIYYNPITNPMKKSIEAPMSTEKPAITLSTEAPEEEVEDDPVAMPVPQVKVGPDGQLIIDEQSLVIEPSNVKRAKEILSTDVIIEDENCRSGGFYKKRQRGKDWPKWETFKFYRVLNVVGTDFSLMQTYFPSRTRQEIKQKYKKEERVNRHLIEKALKYPQEFDTEMLDEQLATLQKLEDVQSRIKKSSEKPKKEQHMTKAARKRRRRFAAKSIGECESAVNDQEDENASDEVDSEASGDTSDVRHQQIPKSKSRKLRRLDLSDKSDDNSSHASSKELDSDSEPEVYQVRPTRSGRLPNLKNLKNCRSNIKRENDDENLSENGNVNKDENRNKNENENTSSIDSIIALSQKVTEIVNVPIDGSSSGDVLTTCPQNAQNLINVIPNINEIEPGSLVILSKESAEDSGNTILQVYMVTSNVDADNADVKHSVTPVDLPAQFLTTVTDKLEEAESINVSNDCEH